MCGIAGHLRLDRSPPDRDLVRRMTSRLRHRGPDGAGYYSDRRIALGHRRLAIIDPKGGGQPMADDTGSYVVAANNEIYNYVELRDELVRQGVRFRTASDTETIGNLFAVGREQSFLRLEGMFAVAVWDVRTETLYLARDRFGIKPLHYYQDGRSFLFASELKALTEYAAFDSRLDEVAVDDYFGSLAVPEPRSIFRSVRKVPPGHYVMVRAGRIHVRPYWTPTLGRSRSLRQRDTRGDELRDRLAHSVRIGLRSDVPVGVLLSGGIDSSSIAVLASRASSHRLHTFSATFQEGQFDEGHYSRLVAARIGTRHHEVRVTKNQATAIAERLAATVDEPFADSSAIPTFAVCALARQHVKTVLSGEGADELLAGYPWHIRPVTPSVDHPARAVFTQRDRTTLYSPEWRKALARRIGPRTSPRRRATLRRALLDDLYTYLPSDILVKSDRVSMRHSLEVRVPFLNHSVADYILGLPNALKTDGTIGKIVLRRAMRRLLPPSILKRPKKGFSIPMDAWLWEKGGWRDLVYDTIFSRRTRERGQFNMATLQRLQREHDGLQQLHGYRLWTVFVFEMWQRRHLERSA